MDFTEWLESLTPLIDFARIITGLGLTTVLLAYLKHTIERRNWRKFKTQVNNWINLLVESDRHPKTLLEEEWQVECERMLSVANFGPVHIQQLLKTAVLVAKGIAADKVFI